MVHECTAQRCVARPAERRPACTVAAVAAKWGFRHMPRFAQYYRSAFGKMPSETLKRVRH
ncbi:helix-turn-helix domain-containing protein [Paraburkholderia sacchari]|uniref:helix-turn-helix domain-containing protein n=1 Tax=Paraburkholderia sacchari TaxID=159450 RepID=UPI0038B2D08A